MPTPCWPGIIPALAGNTVAGERGRVFGPDHPRSRGEYPHDPAMVGGRLGSSPLSRGIRLIDTFIGVECGIIPALAGNTSWCDADRRTSWDHPRSRGEYVTDISEKAVTKGSSPLSRGIPPAPHPAILRVRIIPALAGNTVICTSGAASHWDHPRSRGEYGGFYFRTRTGLGSSPLSRGIHHRHERNQPRRGIIPALAGNTTGWKVRDNARKDHPRSRGEY